MSEILDSVGVLMGGCPPGVLTAIVLAKVLGIMALIVFATTHHPHHHHHDRRR